MDKRKSPECPSPDRLRGLLSEELAVADRDAVTQHIQTCSLCQRILDGWLASSSIEGLAVAGKDSATQEVALRELMDQIKKKSADEATRAEIGAGSSEDNLAFLAPSTKPGRLGRLGQYEIISIVGKGGFGTVFKAFDEKLHRMVAIKVLAPEVAASGTARKRFIREAQAAAAVKNDHIVAIYNVADEANPPYLVMELIDGISLDDQLRVKGPLELKEILRIGMQMAEGLAAAHKQGLIHRDIKPGNVLLENGVQRVKITDFGLARTADDANLTQSGVIAGTPMFMSPEQAEGLPLDQRSDLFSLGSVLYVMCTGRAPFRANTTMAVLKRVCEETPKPIHEINPDVPKWLSTIVEKLQAKKADDRFASAKEIAELLGKHLADVQAGRSDSSRTMVYAPADEARDAERERARFPVLIPLMLIALLAAGLFGAGWYWSSQTTETAESAPQANADSKTNTIPTNSPKKQGAGEEIVHAPPMLSPTPFAVLAKEKRSESRHATLAAAVAAARSGDTIEIRGDGPFVVSAIELKSKELTVKAAPGFWPVLTQAPDSVRLDQTLLTTRAPLTLEGLEWRREGGGKSGAIIQLILSEAAPLFVANCRFVAVSLEESAPAAVRCQRAPVIEVRNCQFLGDWHAGVYVADVATDSRATVANCLFLGKKLGVAFGYWSKLPTASLQLVNNTFVNNSAVGVPNTYANIPSDLPGAPTIRIEARRNIWTHSGLAMTFRTTSNVVEDFLSRDHRSLARQLVKVESDRNQFTSGTPIGGFTIIDHTGIGQNQPALTTLNEWNEFWGPFSTDVAVDRPRFAKDLSPAYPDAEQLMPLDFRPSSVAPNLKDVGADVGLVGPGQGYERWLKTPMYQEWRKKTEDPTHVK